MRKWIDWRVFFAAFITALLCSCSGLTYDNSAASGAKFTVGGWVGPCGGCEKAEEAGP